MPVFKKGKLWLPDAEKVRQEEIEREKQKVTCTEKQNFTATNCPSCDARIIVHCPQCNIKVTGCGCTMKERIESVKDEMIERLYQ